MSKWQRTTDPNMWVREVGFVYATIKYENGAYWIGASSMANECGVECEVVKRQQIGLRKKAQDAAIRLAKSLIVFVSMVTVGDTPVDELDNIYRERK